MSIPQPHRPILTQSCKLLLSMLACLIFTIAFVTFRPAVAAAAPAAQIGLTAEQDALSPFGDDSNGPFSDENMLDTHQADSSNGGGEIEFGIPVTGTILTPGQVDTYPFYAQADDTVFALMGSPGSLQPGIRIHGPDGVPLADCEAGGYSSAEISSCRITATGTHTILAYDSFQGIAIGAYGLTVQRTNNPVNAASINWSEATAGVIWTAGQADSYSFSAGVGDAVSLRMSSDDSLQPGIRIHGPDGFEVGGCRASGYLTAEISSCILSESGIYTILAYDSFHGTALGDYFISLSCLTPLCEADTPPSLPLVLIYAVLDNNLGDDPEAWRRLVNNAELGKHDDVNVRLFVDGPEDDDAYVYDIQHDDDPACPNRHNPTCGGAYTEGQNFWKTEFEDAAHPQTLYDFVEEALAAYPDASTVSLSLVGHGAGWTANALPGQPSKWGSQPGDPPNHEERIGGLLWDDTPGDGGTSRSMSTKALGVAMDWIADEIGAPLDLLYLDACSMGMAEIAYEIRDSAEYLLASPNTAWASFAYDEMLRATNKTQNGQEIGSAWLNAEADALGGGAYPYTLSLIDLGKMTDLTTPSSTFADLMSSADTVKIRQAFTTTDHYESDYNGALEAIDSYVDMNSFATQVGDVFNGDGAIVSAAQTLANTIENAVIEEFRPMNGEPWPFPGQAWEWTDPGGLSVYLPLAEDEVKRALYTSNSLKWAADTTWDEFLAAFWGIDAAALRAYADELPTCESTRNCEPLAKQLKLNIFSIYLPTVQNAP